MLAADSTRLRELQSAVRQFLAWDSIWDDRETLNLDPFQTKQAETKLRTSDETVDARIPETFQWLLVPGQSDPKGDIEWTEIRLQGQDSLGDPGREEAQERRIADDRPWATFGFGTNWTACRFGGATTSG